LVYGPMYKMSMLTMSIGNGYRGNVYPNKKITLFDPQEAWI